MIWFTADHHFGHKSIIKYCNRPFDNVNEMDNIMIENWNSVVNELDMVYYLGDIVFGNREKFDEIISRLYGNIKIIPGNHDWKWLKDWDRYFDYMQPKSLSGIGVDVIEPLYDLHYNKNELIVLCHYPLATWNKSHYNSYHLHGHSHGKFSYEGKIYDVGVDNNGFYPVNLNDILKIMKDKPDNINYIGNRNG